jgi:hypothetical protein
VKNWLIEDKLNATRRRWKWLELGRWIGVAGSVFCVIWFLIQLAGWQGLLSRWMLDILIVLMALGGLMVLLVIFLATEARREKRSWLANALERSCPPLMDRVNTLVFLEEDSRGRRPSRIQARIEDQAGKVIAGEKLASPFSAERTLTHLGVFVLLLGGVIFFQVRFDPFKALFAETAPESASKIAPFQLAPQSTVTETQEKKVWGEVHIVDPGRDVKLTKVDVLPLQIEMTTSDTMEKPVWVTSVDGGEESAHDLAAPTDRNYMVYQPLIYLDQMKVTDWDVVSYYAKVSSAAPADYASPLNFIDIRPFREDILKMTGGKDGQANKRYELFSELTGLIKEQTHQLQQTHQHQGTTYVQDSLRLQDAKKLSQGEDQLATATNHFYGKVAAEGENTPVGSILDELSQAEQQMNRASAALQDDVAAEGKQQEQGALTHLVACRKAFQKIIMDHPDAFGGGSGDSLADEPTPTASDSLKALTQVSEMRDRDQAALQSLHQLTARQQALSQARGADLPSTPRQQMDVRSDLRELMDQNAELFRGSEPQAAAVQGNMMQSILNLSSGKIAEARQSMSQTADSLRDLERAVNHNHEGRQMEQAYKLKNIIDQNVGQLAQEKAKPGSLTNQQVKDLTASAQRSTSTLKDIVDQDQGRSFGPKLGQALSAGNQQALDNALTQFSDSPAGASRGEAASAAQQGLQDVSQAFDQSQPELTSQIRGQDQLQPQPGDALDDAQQQLQSMLLAAAGQPSGAPSDRGKAMGEVLHDLQQGLNDPKFDPAQRAQIMADADDALKKMRGPGGPVDPAALKKLLDEIESVRIEVNDPNQTKPPALDITQVDPSKFPPAYRDRLRAYFEHLSEQSH